MKRNFVTVLFLTLEGLLYAAFLILDLQGRRGDTLALKYAGILLCLCFALLRGGRLIAAALALTAAADWFLLIRGDHLFLGVGIFLCVQSLYALHLRRAGAGSVWPLRVGLALLFVLAAFLLELANPLNLLALVYFSQLVSNAVLAWTCPAMKRFALGLTLFIGCDVCVGLFNTPFLSGGLFSLVSMGMWLFYLPSQVLIALSVLPQKEVSP